MLPLCGEIKNIKKAKGPIIITHRVACMHYNCVVNACVVNQCLQSIREILHGRRIGVTCFGKLTVTTN